MQYYEKRVLGVWRPRTTTLEVIPTGPTVRNLATVKVEHRDLKLDELAAIYGEDAKHVAETQAITDHLNAVADALAPGNPPLTVEEVAPMVKPASPEGYIARPGGFTRHQLDEMREENEARAQLPTVKPAPFSDPRRINDVAEKLGLNIGRAYPGELMQNLMIPILETLTDRLLALEDQTPVGEAVAARYDFDGQGWLYMDAGDGSDWRKRAAQYPDHEWLYGGEA